MLTIHHQPDKRETYAELRPYYFDSSVDALVVLDKDLIAAIFRSEDFRVIDFADHSKVISERTGLDLDASIKTLDHVPFTKEGDEHKRLRSEMNSVIAANSRSTIEQMEAFVAELVAQLFTAGSNLELVEQLARPVFHKLFMLWLHVDHREFLKTSDISQVFDAKISLNRRKKVNESLQRVMCAFEERRDRIPTTPESAVAMNVLGNDALMGSLILSTWHILEQHPGSRLCDIEFPQTLPATGVPYIERMANRDMDFNGMRVVKDQRIRLLIDATSQQVAGEEADLFFGKGRHLCIGKPMTLIVWRSFAKAVTALPLRFTLGEMRLRSGDYAFTYPELAKIEIHD